MARSEPDPVDVHVGRRVRLRRRALGVSQSTLAEQIGLTFQQIQKYERGSNRISVSKLYRIAEALSAPIGFFFDGLPDPMGSLPGVAQTAGATDAFLIAPGGGEMARAFLGLKPGFQRSLIRLARDMGRHG